MKSRSSSPQTSPQIVRRFRVNSNPTGAGTSASPASSRKPSARMEEMPPIAINGLSPLKTAQSGGGSLTPVYNGMKRPSSENLNQHTPGRDTLQANGTNATTLPTVTPSPVSENANAGWSSAVGHATTSGKSGRVIERLMTENDKLKRDLNAQVIKCQELEKSMQTYRPQIEALRQENDNLSHARSVDSSLIARRDRKIDELKGDLTSERGRRETAEELARRREREKDDMEEQTRREVQSLTESTRHSTLHAEILETSHKQLSAEYRARAEAWKHDLDRLTDGRDQDRQKLAKLDIVADQMRHELERSKRLNTDIIETWERFQRDISARLEGMEQETTEENDRVRYLSDQMDKVIGEMRWLMGVKRNVRDADSVMDNSE